MSLTCACIKAILKFMLLSCHLSSACLGPAEVGRNKQKALRLHAWVYICQAGHSSLVSPVTFAHMRTRHVCGKGAPLGSCLLLVERSLYGTQMWHDALDHIVCHSLQALEPNAKRGHHKKDLQAIGRQLVFISWSPWRNWRTSTFDWYVASLSYLLLCLIKYAISFFAIWLGPAVSCILLV